MPEVIIRPYNHETDFQQVTANLQQAGLYYEPRDTEPLLARTAQERPDGILVASLGGVAVGNVFVGDIYPLVSGLAVDPAHRRQGIATRLGFAAEQQLRARGHTYMEALIDSDRDDLRALYEARGFRVAYSCKGMVKFFDPSDPIPSGLIEGVEVLTPDQRNFERVYTSCQPRYPGATYFQAKPHVLDRFFQESATPLRNLRIETECSPPDLIELAASPIKIELLPTGPWTNRWVRYPTEPGSAYDLLGYVVEEYTGIVPTCAVLGRERVFVARDRQTGQLIPFETTDHRLGKVWRISDDHAIDVMRRIEDVARECHDDLWGSEADLEECLR